MILFTNVKITSKRLYNYPRANWLKYYDRDDIFVYSLYSLAELQEFITRSVFFVEIGEELTHSKDRIESEIKKLFPNAELFFSRNTTTNDWRATLNDLFAFVDDNELILFCGNDDHIFVDYNLEVLREGLDILRNDPSPNAVLYYSHFAEQCRWSYFNNGKLTDSKNYVCYQQSNFDSIHILKLSRIREYFFSHFYKGDKLYRFDDLRTLRDPLVSNIYCPTRKLFDHYDGYGHIVSGWPYDKVENLDDLIPPLVIPPGFFNEDIKIRIGYNDRKEDWVNINPCANHLYTAVPNFPDYKFLLDDVPLFWKKHIKEIDISPDYDEEKAMIARDKHFLATTQIPMKIFLQGLEKENCPPLEWFNNHLRYGKN